MSKLSSPIECVPASVAYQKVQIVLEGNFFKQKIRVFSLCSPPLGPIEHLFSIPSLLRLRLDAYKSSKNVDCSARGTPLPAF